MHLQPRRFSPSLCLLVLLAVGCSKPVTVVVNDPKFAFEVEDTDGFYAFTTALDPRDGADIVMLIAPESYMTRPLELFGDPDQLVYKRTDAIFVRPDSLAGLADAAKVDEAPNGGEIMGFWAIDLGLQRGKTRRRGDDALDMQTHASGARFGDVPESVREKVIEEMGKMRAFAGSYGGDAVVNIRLHRNDWDTIGATSIVPSGHWMLEAELVALP